MNSCTDLIEYYDNLKNNIDIECEKKLAKVTDPDIANELNELRNNYLTHAERCFKTNLEALKSSLTKETDKIDLSLIKHFCFFIQHNNQDEHLFGMLVLTNQYIPIYTRNSLNFHYKLKPKKVKDFDDDNGDRNDESDDGKTDRSEVDESEKQDEEESHEDENRNEFSIRSVIMSILLYFMIEKRKHHLKDGIIDFTKPSKSNLYLVLPMLDSITENDLDFVHNLIDKEHLKEIKIDAGIEIQAKTFSMFDQVQKLELFNFGYSTFKLKADCFYGLSNLKKLIISCITPESVDKLVFNSLPNLEYLEIQRCELQKLKYDCFSNLSSVKYAILKRTNLKAIEPLAFKGFENVKVLDLNENVIRKFPRNGFIHLKNLAFLNLKNALDIDFDASCLNVLNKLEYLDLTFSDNYVDISNLEVLNLPRLKYLAVDSDEVPTFNNLPSLEYLNLRSLTGLEKEPFSKLTSLKGLRLVIIEEGLYNKIRPYMFKKLPNLVYLQVKLKYFSRLGDKFEERNEVIYKGCLAKCDSKVKIERNGKSLQVSNFSDFEDFLYKEIKFENITEEEMKQFYDNNFNFSNQI